LLSLTLRRRVRFWKGTLRECFPLPYLAVWIKHVDVKIEKTCDTSSVSCLIFQTGGVLTIENAMK
jgi:hypothetical protein